LDFVADNPASGFTILQNKAFELGGMRRQLSKEFIIQKVNPKRAFFGKNVFKQRSFASSTRIKQEKTV
jgi:hypothetical protein